MCPDKLDTTAEFQTWRRVRVGQRRLSRFCQPMYFFPEKGLSQNRPPPSARVCSHPATTRSPQNRVFFFWKLHVSSYHTPALLRLPLFKTGNRNECPHRPGPVWETLHDISFHPHESWELASITLVLGMEKLEFWELERTAQGRRNNWVSRSAAKACRPSHCPASFAFWVLGPTLYTGGCLSTVLSQTNC